MLYFTDKQTQLADIFSRYPHTEQGRRSALMPLLREVQNALGHVPEENIAEIAALIGSTATEVKSVMSFYSTYHTTPTGKWHLQVCATLSCAIAGSDELWDYLVDELGIGAGEVTADGLFSIQKVECLGSCGTAPMIQVSDIGFSECITRSKMRTQLERLRAGQTYIPDTVVPVFIQDGQQLNALEQRVGGKFGELEALKF
jgi:NADH-quinone oxidoreductase subunit E